MADPQTSGLPDGWDIVTPGPPPKAPAPEGQGVGQRMLAAVGPTIRGVGDVTGINRVLEATGAVDPGRLTGDEANTRDASTRTGASVAGGVAMGADAVAGLVNLAKQGGVRAVLKGAAAMTVIPAVKYELTKQALEALHFPTAMAIPIAMTVSGYQFGKGAVPEAAEAVRLTGEKPPTPMEAPRDLTNRLRAEQMAKAGGVDAAKAKMSSDLDALSAEIAARRGATSAGTAPPSPDIPAGSTPVQSVAPAAPPPPASGPPASAAPKFPTQKALNELALAARRAKLTLTPDTEQAGLDLMRKGAPAEQVVARLQQMEPLKTRLSGSPEDIGAYLKLRQAGKSSDEALSAIDAMRTLRKRFSLPTADDVKTSFQQLYARGQKTAPHE